MPLIFLPPSPSLYSEKVGLQSNRHLFQAWGPAIHQPRSDVPAACPCPDTPPVGHTGCSYGSSPLPLRVLCCPPPPALSLAAVPQGASFKGGISHLCPRPISECHTGPRASHGHPAAAGPEGFREEEPPLTGGRQNCVARPSRTPWNGRSSEGVAFADTNKSASCLKERHVAHCDPEGTA